MMGYYNKDFFIEQTKIYNEESGSWSDRALSMAGMVFLKNKNKKEPLRSIKSFFPQKVKRNHFKRTKRCFIKCNKTIR